jgi:hypothetical protein
MTVPLSNQDGKNVLQIDVFLSFLSQFKGNCRAKLETGSARAQLPVKKWICSRKD